MNRTTKATLWILGVFALLSLAVYITAGGSNDAELDAGVNPAALNSRTQTPEEIERERIENAITPRCSEDIECDDGDPRTLDQCLPYPGKKSFCKRTLVPTSASQTEQKAVKAKKPKSKPTPPCEACAGD